MSSPETLSLSQIEFYRTHGYLVLERRIPDDVIAALRGEIARFTDEARGLTASNDRIDLEDSHHPDAPRLRRIKLPHTTSAVVRDLMTSDHVLAPVRHLTGPAGSISIHHARIVHGSPLNTSMRDRRLLFYEVMAADAFPVMGAMTTFDGIEEYNRRMLCGKPTLTPRLAPVPVRIPQPHPDSAGSIYEIQGGLQTRAFDRI